MTDKELFGNSEQLSSCGHEKDHVGDPNKMEVDLISRQAALNIAHKLTIPGEEFHQNNQAIGNYMAELVKLPSAQQWIPCSERLPEEEKGYLVTFASGNVGMSSWHKDTFNRGFNRGFDAYMTGVTEDGECEYFGVVAWMEKPEPWKGEKE